jgi:hypothetical protein
VLPAFHLLLWALHAIAACSYDHGASPPACDSATSTLVQTGLEPIENDPEAQEACAAATAETGVACAPFVVILTWHTCTSNVAYGARDGAR